MPVTHYCSYITIGPDGKGQTCSEPAMEVIHGERVCLFHLGLILTQDVIDKEDHVS